MNNSALIRLSVLFAVLAVGLAAARAEESRPPTEADQQFEFAEELFKVKAYRTAAAEYRVFLRDYPQDPRCEEARYNLALCHFKLGGEAELNKALAELAALRKEFPAGVRLQDCLFRLGHIRYLLGDSKGALAELGELAKLDVRPDLQPMMHHFLGRAYYDLGQNTEAVEHLARVAADDKTHPLRQYALILLADAYLKLGKVKEHSETLATLVNDYKDLPTKDEMWLRLGEARLALKEFASALDAYGSVDAASPWGDQAALGAARALFGLKKYADVERACETLLARFQPTSATEPLQIPEQCLYLIGLANFERGRNEAALDAFNKLLAKLRQGSTAEDAALKVCWCYYRMGESAAKKLIAACVDFRRLFPASAWVNQVVFLAAEGHLWLGDHKEAIAHYKQVPAGDANYADALYRIAYCHHKLRNPEDAARAYDAFAGSFQSHSKTALALLGAGRLYQAAEKYREAIGRYEKYLATNPDGPEAEDLRFQRGVCYAKLNEFDQMATAFAEYVKAHPTGRNAGAAFYWIGRHHRARGDALMEKGKAADAVAEYKLAEQALASGAGQGGVNREEVLLAIAECLHNLGQAQADWAAELVARAKGAEEPRKRQLEEQAAALRAESAAALDKAAGGFLELMTAKPELLKSEDIYFWTGAHFRVAKAVQPAAQAFRAAVERFKDSKRADAALFQLALLYGEIDPPDHTAVIRFCDELIRRFPDSNLLLLAQFTKAEALWTQGRDKHKDASDLYVAVAQKGAGQLKVKSTMRLGHIALADEQHATAARYFAEVGILYNDDEFCPEALYYAGKANVSLKEVGEGVRFWQQLLKRYPASQWAAAATQDLGAMGYTVSSDGTIRKN